MDAAVALFHSLSDSTRLAIVRRLAGGEVRVADLVGELGLAQSTVSAHVACLRDCGLVEGRPQGRQVFYSLTRPELMDLLFANVEGWPGITSPEVKDFIAEHQIDAAGWFVANPQVTVVDVRRYQRMDKAVAEFLDAMSANAEMDATTRKALAKLSEVIAVPQGVDY